MFVVRGRYMYYSFKKLIYVPAKNWGVPEMINEDLKNMKKQI